MKRVAIIGTVGIPSKYGGFETLAHFLTKELKDEFDFTVYCSKKSYTKKERIKELHGAKLVYLPFEANGAQSIIYDMISMIHAIFIADTLLILGVSGGLLIPFLRLFTRKKIIVNIDGLEWRRNKWGKFAKKFLKLSERVAVKFSHGDITDNLSIKRYTSINYKTLSNLIEYGGDHTVKVGVRLKDRIKYGFLGSNYAFKVARIEPENNIHVVLEAFSKLKMKLVVIGNWENSEYGQKLKADYSKYSNIVLLDPIYEQRTLDLIRGNCSLYIHGHSAGGTNPSLVEAMSLALPIISFDVSYNRATTEDKCLYFKTAKELISVVENSSKKTLTLQKEVMLEIATRRYSWASIARKYKNLIYSFDYDYSKQHIRPKMSLLNRKKLQGKGVSHLKYTRPYYK